MSRRRVVVTGLGCVSPVGNTVADSWANVLAGTSGIDLITHFDASNLACKFAGEVKGFNIADYIPEKEARHMDRFIHLGLAAACQAVADSGLPTGDALGRRDGHAHRLQHRLGHWRFAADRAHAWRTREPRPAPHFAVFCACNHHQHDLRPCVDQVRLQGPQHRRRDGLHHRPACHRPVGTHD